MSKSFLMQTEIVESLLDAIIKTLPFIPEGKLKQELNLSLENFRFSITPSAISVSDVYENLPASLQHLDINQAVELLKISALDIDQNYASEAVAYHVDEYISNRP